LHDLRQDGATSLLSKHRGKPSNHRLPAEIGALALSIVRERYVDLPPNNLEAPSLPSKGRAHAGAQSGDDFEGV